MRELGSFREKQLLAFGDWLFAGVNWVRFAEIGGGGTLWVPGLGSFCVFWLLALWDWVRFAFLVVGQAGIGVNWVRFAFLGGGVAPPVEPGG